VLENFFRDQTPWRLRCVNADYSGILLQNSEQCGQLFTTHAAQLSRINDLKQETA
jgi:hypothetical protein